MFFRMRHSWVWVLALFSVASLIEAAFWNQMNVFTPLYLPHLGITDPEDVKRWVGAIGVISGFIGLPFLPFWGALADRYARQPIIVRSFVAHLLAGVFALLAGNIWVFLFGRAIMSFSLGNSGLMLTTLSERVPQGRVGLAFSIMSGASPLGAFLGPLVGGPVVDHWGFPTLIAIDTGLMLAVILSLIFGYKDDFVGTDRGPLLRMAVDSLSIIVRSPRLRALFPALFLAFSGWLLAFTYIALAIASIYHGPDLGTVTGQVIGLGGLATLVLSPAIGSLADRFGHWRMLFIGSIASIVLWPLPALTTGIVPFAFAWAAINGVSSAVFALSFSVLASSTSTDVRGRVMAFAYLPVNLAGAVGAGIGSIVTQGNIFNMFPVAAILTALGTGALALASRQPVAPSTQMLEPGEAEMREQISA
jgi:MFS family permease